MTMGSSTLGQFKLRDEQSTHKSCPNTVYPPLLPGVNLKEIETACHYHRMVLHQVNAQLQSEDEFYPTV